jgi:DNA-binding transcriptional regulator YiaG
MTKAAHEAKDLRRRLEWTQLALAKFCEVAVGTVSRWEQGKPAMPGAVRKLLLLELERRRRPMRPRR